MSTRNCPHCNEPIELSFFDFGKVRFHTFLCPSCKKVSAFSRSARIGGHVGGLLSATLPIFFFRPYLNGEAGDPGSIALKVLAFAAVCLMYFLASAYFCRVFARTLVK